MKYFTFIGNHDQIGPDTIGYGAALTIFLNYKDQIDGIYIFTSKDKETFPYMQMAEKNMHVMQQEKPGINVQIVEMDLDNPVNFDIVYTAILDEYIKIDERDSIKDEEKIINITSGTPTMTTCWVLLQKSDLIPNARLIQSFEPKFQRKYGKVCQEVKLDIEDFPEINTPSKEKSELNRINTALKELKDESQARQIDDSIPGLVGQSIPILEIKEQILRQIDSLTHVLILGEPGTGKEVVSRAIWNLYRKDEDKDRLIFDCGQFDSNLILSELFGYKKGAFTGADRDQDGIIEKCNGRMLFLDEIGSIPLNRQSVFMRFLQFGEWRQIGSDRVNKSNIQIIAATNKDVNDTEIFASDLRDRFDEIIIIPPLRERTGDVEVLVKHFLLKNDSNISFSKEVYNKLREFPWPGNVRQLQQWVNRMCRYYKDTLVDWDEIPSRMKPEIDSTDDEEDFTFPDFPIDLYNYIDNLKFKALDATDGNKAQADRLLGLKEGTMKQWLYQREKRKK